MIDKKYIITSTCLSIKGFNRDAIYDLPKNKYEFIPNSISDFLRLLSKKTFYEIYNNTPTEYKEIIIEYLEYCLEKEYILEIPNQVDAKNFPKLNLNFEYPSIITNLSLNICTPSTLSPDNIKNILLITKCYNIHIILEKNFDVFLIENYLKIISNIGIRSIELIMPYETKFNYERLTEIYKNISFIFIYSAPYTKFIKPHYFGLQQIFTSEKDFKITHTKSLEFFNVNIQLFTESQKHNTDFNRKLHIGANGEIKNALLAPDVFGNINALENTEGILKIIETKEFQKYWYVHKGLIDVCKQCEFRHMCVDNRVPEKRNEKSWYFESECNYNPYIAKWQDEAGYKTLAECGIKSNAEGFKINRKKLNAINKELWGDD